MGVFVLEFIERDPPTLEADSESLEGFVRFNGDNVTFCASRYSSSLQTR